MISITQFSKAGKRFWAPKRIAPWAAVIVISYLNQARSRPTRRPPTFAIVPTDRKPRIGYNFKMNQFATMSSTDVEQNQFFLYATSKRNSAKWTNQTPNEEEKENLYRVSILR